jgi:hypothetical protein
LERNKKKRVEKSASNFVLFFIRFLFFRLTANKKNGKQTQNKKAAPITETAFFYATKK